jgi:hypothetical protein
VVDWIDRYAERFKNLTDPVWLQMIEDPNYRWHRRGKEYAGLFRFQDSVKRTEQREKVLAGSGADA